MSRDSRTITVEVFELFTFADGVRYAWVTYRIGGGERVSVSVREAVSK